MTKKHFIALADAIKHHNQHHGATKFTSDQIEQLAAFCRCQNYNFNRELWLSYIAGECGPNGGAIKPEPQPRVLSPSTVLRKRIEGGKP